ncbi:MAG: hypothetical protein PVF67_14905, partial [Anaerolineae bacterium]
MKNAKLLLAIVVILTTLLAACGSTPEPETIVQTVVETVVVEKEGETIVQTVEVEKEVEKTVVETVVETVEVEVVSDEEALRRRTVIFDLDRFLADDANANPYSPAGVSGFRLAGGHQVLWEPFFILNPISGELVPWLATSFESNEAGDVWTLSIREGVKWSDG